MLSKFSRNTSILDLKENISFLLRSSDSKFPYGQLPDVINILRATPYYQIDLLLRYIFDNFKQSIYPLFLLAISEESITVINRMANLGFIKPNLQTSQGYDKAKAVTFSIIAIRENKLKSLEALLAIPENDVNQRAYLGGATAFYVACDLGREQMTKLLITYGANINEQNDLKDTPLKIVILKNHPTLFFLLLEHNVNVNPVDRQKLTPLIIACELKRTTMALELIKNPATDINEKSEPGNTALLFACQAGLETIVFALCERDDCKVNYSNNARITPLMMACQNGHITIVEKLLEKKADINATLTDKKAEVSAIIIAYFNGQADIVKLLLKNKSLDVNKDFSRNVPLLVLCARDGNLPIIDAVLEHERLIIKDRTKKGRNVLLKALEKAAEHGHHEIICRLLKFNKEHELYIFTDKEIIELQNVANEHTGLDGEQFDILAAAEMRTELEIFAQDNDSDNPENISLASHSESATESTPIETNDSFEDKPNCHKPPYAALTAQKGKEQKALNKQKNLEAKSDGSPVPASEADILDDDIAQVQKKYLVDKTWAVTDNYSFNFSSTSTGDLQVFPFSMGSTTAYGVILLSKDDIFAAAKQHSINSDAMLQGKQYKKIVPLIIKGKSLEGYKKICYGGNSQGDMRIVGIELNKLLNKTTSTNPPLYIFAVLKSHKDLDNLSNPEQTLFNLLSKTFNNHMQTKVPAPLIAPPKLKNQYPKPMALT